ncbi:MAG TPA: glycosyltransferase, partial [Usitatibacter sp.]|nr:glycosyltransferase [Usitatibacter sp.]
MSHWLEGEGGIEEHQSATVRQLAGEVAFTVIAPGPPVGAPVDPPFARIPGVRVTRPALHGHAVALRVIGLPAETRDARAEEAFRRELANGHDLVHFQSVVGWNTLRLPRIAREAGARVVVSVHDKSWLCADFNMVLGPQGAPCGRPAARGNDAMCVPCIASKASAHAPLTAGQVAAWLESRYAAAADALAAAHAVACPSEFAASSVRRAFGDSLSVRVIPHGVPDWPALEAPTRGATLRVVHLGRFSMRKGAGALIAAAQQLRPERIDIDAWGPVEWGLEGPAQAAGI